MFLLSSIHIYYGNAYIYQLYFSIYMHVLVDDSWMDEGSKYMFSFKIGYVWTTRLICSDHQEQSNKCDGTYRCVMFILYSIHIHIVMYPPLQIPFLAAKTSNGSEVHP